MEWFGWYVKTTFVILIIALCFFACNQQGAQNFVIIFVQGDGGSEWKRYYWSGIQPLSQALKN